jgi:hypothetical protein
VATKYTALTHTQTAPECILMYPTFCHAEAAVVMDVRLVRLLQVLPGLIWSNLRSLLVWTEVYLDISW